MSAGRPVAQLEWDKFRGPPPHGGGISGSGCRSHASTNAESALKSNSKDLPATTTWPVRSIDNNASPSLPYRSSKVFENQGRGIQYEVNRESPNKLGRPHIYPNEPSSPVFTFVGFLS